MQPIAFDFETALIRPALLAPPPACMTWQEAGGSPQICDAAEACRHLRAWLEDPSVLLIGANTAFDMAVAAEAYPELRALIFAAYAADRVTDVQTRARLLDIAGGTYLGRFGPKGVFIKHGYDLESLSRRYAGIGLQKDEWRLIYGEFIGVPLEAWPARAREVQEKAKRTLAALEAEWQGEKAPKEVVARCEGLRSMIASDAQRCTTYPLDDARATLAVWQQQEAHAAFLRDQYRQARASFWLHLGSAWGIRTDAAGVETLRRETQAAYDALEGELRAAGLLRADGTRDTKRAKRLMLEVCARDGLVVRRTDGHAESGKCKTLDGAVVPNGADECEEHVCLDEDACTATDDETLKAYAEASTLKKVLSNDIPALSGGTEHPLHTRYGLAETGRTTSSKPNIQNLRRLPGIREAFIPRPGRVLLAADYPQLELFTLAQCCASWVGESRLGEALNAGLDPHLAMAARILGLSYEDAQVNIQRDDVDNARQVSKVANFGFPGGLGIDKLILFAKKVYRVELTREQAEALKAQWFETWPEMLRYFARVNALCEKSDSGKALVETLHTQRYRGGASYCAACNNGFQALGSDCAKNAGWLIATEQYVTPTSPLFNARTVAFVHDEFILEVDEGADTDAAASRLADLMAEGANAYLPDVPIPRAKIKPLLMRRWSKKAKPVYGANGRLVPWEQS